MQSKKRYIMNTLPFEDVNLQNIVTTTQQFGVSYWVPRREEIQRIIEIAKMVHSGNEKPTILDIGCGMGFLSYLMAKTEEVNVIGMDPDETSISDSIYVHPNLTLEVGDANDAVRKYQGQEIDVVFNSWMPSGLNLTPAIRNIEAKTIAYVACCLGTTGVAEQSHSYQFGEYKGLPAEGAVSYHPGKNYKAAFWWKGPGPWAIREIKDYLNGKYKRPGIYNLFNKVIIQLRKDIQVPEFPTINTSVPYHWESKIESAFGKLCGVRSDTKRNNEEV